MYNFEDPMKADDDANRYYTEVVFDGQAHSKPLEATRHWHKNHDEWWEVLEGRVRIYCDGDTLVVSAGDPQRASFRRGVHRIKRYAGERAVLKRKTLSAGRLNER